MSYKWYRKGGKMKAEWKVVGLYKADAQKVAEEIGYKQTTPEEILEYARNNKDSELYKCFEWNDSIAAEKYRKIQARSIILNLRFSQEETKGKTVGCFSLTTKTSTYQPTTMFLEQPDEYQVLLKRALSELDAFKRRYHTLVELTEIFEAIENI